MDLLDRLGYDWYSSLHSPREANLENQAINSRVSSMFERYENEPNTYLSGCHAAFDCHVLDMLALSAIVLIVSVPRTNVPSDPRSEMDDQDEPELQEPDVHLGAGGL
jgi:hypothetical protein